MKRSLKIRLLFALAALAAIIWPAFVAKLARAQTMPLVVQTTTSCATSVDGSVVGLLNPLRAPTVAPIFSGSLPAATYYVQITWYDAQGNQTLASPEASAQLSSSGGIQVFQPASGRPAAATGFRLYVGTSSGSETLQASTTGTNYSLSVPLTAGAALPTMNSTICQQVANDAGWPVAGYNVNIVDRNGNTLPSYPMQWQLIGPGGIIHLNQGLPYYNGNVQYPTPLLAQPYNHAPQSISGPLSMMGYNLYQVGRIGVGTLTPGWGLDLEAAPGSPLLGLANASGGYLIGGNGGTAGSCLTSDGTAYDTAGVCESGLNVLNFGAKCDSNGTTGNGTNDRAAIQALLATLSPTLGAKVIIPAGHICRIASTDTTVNTDYLSAAVSNLEVTGGGKLFFDPVLVSGHPTFGTAISGIYAAGLQIYSPGCTLSSVSDPRDITTGRAVTTLISNINLHDFSIASVGSYNSLVWNSAAEPTTNIPLNNNGIAIWCADNVQVHHLNISNFYTDAIEPWGVVGATIEGNLLTDVGFNGLGAGWISDFEISNNTMVGVGQGFEVDALRTSFTGNVVSNFAMNGIWAVGGPSSGTNVSTTFSGNTLTKDAAAPAGSVGIKVACNGATSTCIDVANVGVNTIYGALGAGVYVQPGKAVTVSGTTQTLTMASGSPVGGIQVEEGALWGVLNPVTVSNNTLNFTSTYYQSAIYATGLAATGVQSIVKGNSITAPSFSGGTAWGIYQYSTGLACQENNISSAATAVSSGCPDLATGVRTDCLASACVGGSTYVSGTTYTNTGAVPVDEFVGMTVTGSCTGYAAGLSYNINSVAQAGNGVYNDCAGIANVSFKVLPGETFSATAATLSGSGGTPAITSWSEIVE
jgi:hypothetical protein